MTDREKWEQAEMDLRETMKDLDACRKECDHYVRALEWAITKMQGRYVYECPYPCPDGQHGEDGRCLGTLDGCWMIAALAATEDPA